jgi:nicotinamide mononucleotide adenylyltransferase
VAVSAAPVNRNLKFANKWTAQMKIAVLPPQLPAQQLHWRMIVVNVTNFDYVYVSWKIVTMVRECVRASILTLSTQFARFDAGKNVW